MEWELIRNVLELGGVAVLAVLIFLMYRWDRKATEKRIFENAKLTEDRLSVLLKGDQETRAQHTQVLTELITYLKAKNGGKS